MKYCDPQANLISGASMTNFAASSAIRRDSVERTGGGLVSLAGAYTGAADASFDVEVTSNTIVGDPQTSEPVAIGVGNGTLTNVVADSGSVAQAITVTLIDKGIRTLAAFAPFPYNITLRAKATGPGGNNITLAVDRSAITYTPTTYALPEAVSPGDVEWEGEGYNFGGKTLNADGTISADTARISFGSSPTIYRQYRIFKNGRYVYKLSPALDNNFPQGTRVNAVTGKYAATLADGVATDEIYSDVQTAYDLLSAIQSVSALVAVDGPVANDARPGGMAIADLNLHTSSYVADEQRGGTDYILDADFDLSVEQGVPSEALRVKCIIAENIGEEVWQVSGDVSGRLSDAVTGVLYNEGGYSFTIPLAPGPEIPPEGFKSVNFELSGTASGCYERFVLGAQARTRTYKFRWVERSSECECETDTIVGRPNAEYLGVDPEFDPAEGNNMSGVIPTNILSRYKAIDTWLDSYVGSQMTVTQGPLTVPTSSISTQVTEFVTEHAAIGQQVSAIVKVDSLEIKVARKSASLLRKALEDVDEAFPVTFPTEAAAAFDSVFTEIQNVLAEFSASGGDGVWIRDNTFVLNDAGGASSPLTAWQTATSENKTFIANSVNSKLIRDPSEFMQILEPKINKIYLEAGIYPPFADAGGAGSGVWQDHGGAGWFVSDDGYLPIQPGYYYHSAIMDDSNGDQIPTSTQEFGVGIQIGCISELQPGNTITIEVRDVNAPGKTYQPGDAIRSVVVRADPVAFGGGQDGNDTLTFRVEGTQSSYANYALDLNAPAAYDDNNLSFLITEGAIPFELEDRWTFSIEGGVFRWRTNAGAWVEGVNIAPSVALTAGLSAVFTSGRAPSFAVGDAYGFTAVASNGPVRMEAPDGSAARWTGSTVIESSGGDFDALLMWADMDSGCTIRVQGSDDDFATTPLDQVLPWRRGVIAYEWAQVQSYAKVRVLISGGDGRIFWLWLGTGYTPAITLHGTPDDGTLTRRRAIGGRGGASLAHSHLAASSVDSIEELLHSVEQASAGRFGLVYGGTDGRVVEIDGDLAIEDVFGHGPTDRGQRLHTTTMPLAVVA